MGPVYPLTPTRSPKDLQEAEVFGGAGETRGDLDPGRRAKFLLRTLPWANVCCPFRALKGNSGVLPLLIQKMSKFQSALIERRYNFFATSGATGEHAWKLRFELGLPLTYKCGRQPSTGE